MPAGAGPDRRVLLRPGDTVAVEDPIYTGLKNLLPGMGAQLFGVPVGREGMEARATGAGIARAAAVLVVTSNFQNPTGATLPLAARRKLDASRAARRPGNRERRLRRTALLGRAVAALKQLERAADGAAAQLFESEFPGTARGLGGRAEAADRAAAPCEGSGGPAHGSAFAGGAVGICGIGPSGGARQRVLQAGARAAGGDTGCLPRYLPAGTRWTRPEGGMNVWVRLPAPLDAGELLPRAQREGVAYLPGRYFAVSGREPGALRLSFAGLTPEQIRQGLENLGRDCRRNWSREALADPSHRGHGV